MVSITGAAGSGVARNSNVGRFATITGMPSPGHRSTVKSGTEPSGTSLPSRALSVLPAHAVSDSNVARDPIRRPNLLRMNEDMSLITPRYSCCSSLIKVSESTGFTTCVSNPASLERSR